MNEFQPTEAELEILQVLWQHQPCTIGVIHEQISQQREVGYTTISKQIERMTDKQMLKRQKQGRGYLYMAVPKEDEVQKTMSEHLLNTAYKGSAVKLAMHALGQSKASKEELEALQEWLDKLTDDD